MTLGQVS